MTIACSIAAPRIAPVIRAAKRVTKKLVISFDPDALTLAAVDEGQNNMIVFRLKKRDFLSYSVDECWALRVRIPKELVRAPFFTFEDDGKHLYLNGTRVSVGGKISNEYVGKVLKYVGDFADRSKSEWKGNEYEMETKEFLVEVKPSKDGQNEADHKSCPIVLAAGEEGTVRFHIGSKVFDYSGGGMEGSNSLEYASDFIHSALSSFQKSVENVTIRVGGKAFPMIVSGRIGKSSSFVSYVAFMVYSEGDELETANDGGQNEP